MARLRLGNNHNKASNNTILIVMIMINRDHDRKTQVNNVQNAINHTTSITTMK